MRAAVITGLVITACSHGDAPPHRAPRDAAAVAVAVAVAAHDARAASTTDAAPAIDAGPDARVPGKAVALDDLPVLAGPVDATLPVQLAAADLPIQSLMTMLPTRGLIIAPHSDAVVTGRASATTEVAMAGSLAAAIPGWVAPIPVHGHGISVDLSFYDAPIHDLFGLFADVERRSYVLEPGDLAPVMILAKRIPSPAASAGVAAVIGRVLDIKGGLVYVHRSDSPGLDPALLKLGGPIVEVDVRAAQPGEIYAALAAVGIDLGGAACAAGGATIGLRVKRVKAGAAVAAIAAVSGVAPSPTERCSLPTGDRFRATDLRAVITAGKKRVAIFDLDAGGGPAMFADDIAHDTIGSGYLRKAAGPDDAISQYPPWDPEAPAGWMKVIGKSRLAATMISGDRQSAVLELPDGTWQHLQPRDVWGGHSGLITELVIEPGRLRYTVSPAGAGGPSVQAELVLRAR